MLHVPDIVSPKFASSDKKGNALKNRLAKAQLSTERVAPPHLRPFRRRPSKKALLTRNTQLTDDRTPLIRHTSVQSAIEKTTATPQ